VSPIWLICLGLGVSELDEERRCLEDYGGGTSRLEVYFYQTAVPPKFRLFLIITPLTMKMNVPVCETMVRR
jgi:hypothetical protein